MTNGVRRQSLGRLLVDGGVITSEQLDEALAVGSSVPATG